jgi:DNA-directed RNA polymerase specialized sigma subunit
MREIDVKWYLRKYRSFEYASMNCGTSDNMPLVINERRRNPNGWDRSRYSRIVTIIKGAVDHVLSDDQRTVIMRMYLERNRSTIGEISGVLHRDRTTVGRWHKEAIDMLTTAFDPLLNEDAELTPFEHRFDPKWVFVEQETA